LVQSIASDINLLGAIDTHSWIKQNKFDKDMRIFALVHDSILAEVKEDRIEEAWQIIFKILEHE